MVDKIENSCRPWLGPHESSNYSCCISFSSSEFVIGRLLFVLVIRVSLFVFRILKYVSEVSQIFQRRSGEIRNLNMSTT